MSSITRSHFSFILRTADEFLRQVLIVSDRAPGEGHRESTLPVKKIELFVGGEEGGEDQEDKALVLLSRLYFMISKLPCISNIFVVQIIGD